MQVLYEDEHLLAVDKPVGLLSVPGRGPEKFDSVLTRLQQRFDRVLVVHRLDMDTSGILLFARSLPAQQRISRMFQRRTIEKAYTAWVGGHLSQTEGCACMPLRRDMSSSLPPRHLVDPVCGKPAGTEWKVLQYAENATRLLLRPHTGRSHQLRVHCCALGHPIIGDPIYGGPPAPRMLLHSHFLALKHPIERYPIEITTPVPF